MMKRPTTLSEVLLRELSSDLGLSAERDVDTIRRRCEHEGLSFLTITLPLLSDALEQGIESGRFTCPTNFGSSGSLPRLLGGFFNRVFASSGELLAQPCPDAIFSIRQICRLWKKLKIECSPERNLEAISRYMQVEGELKDLTPEIWRVDPVLDAVSRVVWPQVFPEVDPCDIVCRHGPGATAERKSRNSRYKITYWYDRFEYSFPLDLHAAPNQSFAFSDSEGVSSTYQDIELLSVQAEPGVRVVFVPKTLTTPRVIAIEPSTMQYVQQGLLHYIVPRLESHRLTCRSVRFGDQTVNQRLARVASVDRRLATLDLKDASDRVHLELVRRIFKGSGILDYLEDARSLHATLPDGRNVVLNKFASMGSAICFPVEAMVFYTLVLTAFHRHHGVRPTSASVRRYSRQIDIYGDDIIVPVELVDSVVHHLEAYGLKVNLTKSFRNSLFRESCGGDYFNGYSVKPVYARELPHEDVRFWSPSCVMSWVSASDQFYELGLWKTCQHIRDLVENVVGRRIPRSTHDVGGLGFKSYSFNTDCRWNNHLYRYQQKRIQYVPGKCPDRIDGDRFACFNRAIRRETSSTEEQARSDWSTFERRGWIASPSRSIGIDFVTSVKRGTFKPKYRWFPV